MKRKPTNTLSYMEIVDYPLCHFFSPVSSTILEAGEHPARLKDAVCSPGGTTIEGVYALEKGGMRAAVMDALGATIEKTQRLSK